MMHDRSRKKRPRDINQLAASIVADTTSETEPDEELPLDAKGNEKDPLAVALGRRGGLKGGRARAKKLSPERRSEIAQLAAAARWKKKED